jgi:hypothetical protein
MLLALAVILMQAPAMPPPALPVVYTSAAVVSAPAAPGTKSEVKPDAKTDTKSDVKDGERKSAESKEANTVATSANALFPAGNVSYQPGQTAATPIAISADNGVSANNGNTISDAPGTFSSSLNPAGGEPVMLVTPVKQKRPEAVGIGVPKMWFVLGAVEHGAATFDAWSTRRNIEEGTMHEANPLLRPFANSNAMYAAVQVAPVLFDLLSRQMMRNSHSWVRKSWWAPQSASTVASILSGAHNVAIH